jgi:hypothetical protein
MIGNECGQRSGNFGHPFRVAIELRNTSPNTAYTLRADALYLQDIAPYGRNVVYAGNVIHNSALKFSEKRLKELRNG